MSDIRTGTVISADGTVIGFVRPGRRSSWCRAR
jgi:hypothetical protein